MEDAQIAAAVPGASSNDESLYTALRSDQIRLLSLDGRSANSFELSIFKFGDASAQPSESPSAHLRRLLRSPSAEMGDRRTPAQAESGREGSTPGPRERNGSDGECTRSTNREERSR